MKNRSHKFLTIASSMLLAVLFCCFIRLDQLVSGEVTVATLGIDSDQFLSVAGSLVNVPVPLVGGVSRFESGFDIRTPVYPAILSGALILLKTGVSLNVAVIVLHSVILALTVIGLFHLLGNFCSRTAIAAAFLVSALPMRHHFFMVLAEWPAFCFLTLFLASTARIFSKQHSEAVFLPVFLASLTTLTRPDYVILFPVAALAALLRFRRPSVLIKPFFLGALPVFVLLQLNLYRYQRITLAPAEGHAFALLSPFSNQAEIEQQLGDCEMPGISVPPMATGITPSAKQMILLAPESQIEAGTTNLNHLTDAFYAAGYRNWNDTNDCLLSVSRALLSKNRPAYFANYLYSLMTLLWLIPFVLLALVWRSSLAKEATPLGILFAVTLCSHILHVAFVSAVNIMHLRYYIVSFSPLILCIYLITSRRFLARTPRKSK